jgi:riboflavin synthase
MFTGIVEERGVVVSRAGARLTVRCPTVSSDAVVGASVAVNGTCLTVVDRRADEVSFDLTEETLARTGLGRLAAGEAVNLERPATLSSRLGGHLVQGHVDGLGQVSAILPEGDGGARLSVRLPRHLLRYVVEQGSLALDGVSLTVAAVEEDVIEVALIPHTLRATSFGDLREGDPVNVEVDVVAKYVARNMESLLNGGDSGEHSAGTAEGGRAQEGRTWTNA